MPTDPDIDEFLHALSAAILTWQKVEQNVFLIFNLLLGPHQNPNVLSAAYHSVVNLNSRLGMINAAAAVALAESPLLKDWEKLRKRIGQNAARRNILVHFTLHEHIDANGRKTLRMLPSIFDARDRGETDYDINQIVSWRRAFIELSNSLENFWHKASPVLRA